MSQKVQVMPPLKVAETLALIWQWVTTATGIVGRQVETGLVVAAFWLSNVDYSGEWRLCNFCNSLTRLTIRNAAASIYVGRLKARDKSAIIALSEIAFDRVNVMHKILSFWKVSRRSYENSDRLSSLLYETIDNRIYAIFELNFSDQCTTYKCPVTMLQEL